MKLPELVKLAAQGMAAPPGLVVAAGGFASMAALEEGAGVLPQPARTIADPAMARIDFMMFP
jgi:hypothetical protein